MGGFAGGVLSSLQLGMNLSRQREREQQQQDLMKFRQDQLDIQRDALAQKRLDSALAGRRLDLDIRAQDDDVAYQNELVRQADERLALDRDIQAGVAAEAAQKRENELSTRLVTSLQKRGWISPENQYAPDLEAIGSTFQGPLRKADEQLLLNILNSTYKSADVTFNKIDPRVGEDGVTRYFVRGTHVSDGAPAVLTALGSTIAEDPAVGLTGEQAARLVGEQFDSIYSRAYTPEQGQALLVATGNAKSQAEAAAEDAARRENAAVAASLAQNAGQNPDGTQRLDVYRAYLESRGNISDPEQKRQFTRQFAEGLGQQFTAPTGTMATDIIGAEAPEETSQLDELGATLPIARTGTRTFGASGLKAAASRVAGLDRRIAQLESNFDAATDPAQKERLRTRIDELQVGRQEFVEKTNTASLSRVTSQIEEFTAKRDKAIGEKAKGFWQSKIDELAPQQKELQRATGAVTPAMETAAYKELEAGIMSRLQAMTPDEVEEAIKGGQLRLPDAQLNALRQRLNEAGVEKPEDIKKLPSGEQLAAYAVLSVLSEDPGQREFYAKSGRNAAETGYASISAKDAAEIEGKRENAFLRAGELQLERDKYLGTLATGVQEAAGDAFDIVTDAFFDKADNTTGARASRGADGAEAFFNIALPQLITLADASTSSQERAQYNKQMGRGISMAINRMAGDRESEGFMDTWQRWIGATTSPNAALTGTDFDLRRVRLKERKNGRPAVFVYTNSVGGQSGREISAFAVRNKSQQVYDALVAAAERNAQAK